MNVVCKITTELSLEEINKINALYKEVFHINRTPEVFLANYTHTPFNYSYHSILYNDSNDVVGFHSCMPFKYIDGNKEFKVGLGIDSMVRKEYRDFFSFHDMIKACHKKLKNDGYALRIGFPNDNAYPVLKKGMKYKDIGKLNTYFLIKNVGGVKKELSFLNPLSRLFSETQLFLSRLSNNGKIHEFRFKKDRKSFNKVRYKWFDGDYKSININGAEATYRIKNQEGVETAFIMDVYPLSKKNFDKAVREIYKKEHTKIDMIIYVGNLPFTPLSLIRMPHKFEPKRFNFTCFPLVKDAFDDSLYDINNWDVNLSNYDLL